MNAIPTSYQVLYNGKNITRDISASLISLTYSDKVEGESDELQIQLSDADGLWQNAWYPEKKSTLTATIEHDGQILKCGEFTIDEVDFSSGTDGDVVNIKAISAAITMSLKTKKSSAHENKTLGEIARTIAAKHGLTVQGIIRDFRLERTTQMHSSDLKFLQKLAINYGYTFSVKGKVMVFTDVYNLEGSQDVLTIDKTEITNASIKDKSFEVFKNATVKYHNPTDSKVYEHTEESDADGTDDTLEVREKAENQQQAELKAKSLLHRKNSFQMDGSLLVPGNPRMVSGVNFEFTGAGKFSGRYHIVASTHTVDRSSAYATNVEIKRIGKISEIKHLPKKIRKTNRTNVPVGNL